MSRASHRDEARDWEEGRTLHPPSAEHLPLLPVFLCERENKRVRAARGLQYERLTDMQLTQARYNFFGYML
jgi:hypothetical protein